MKMKNILVVLLFGIMMSESVIARTFEVKNLNDGFKHIEINPVWSGKQRIFEKVVLGDKNEYDSGIYKLRLLEWRLPSGVCYRANLENDLGAMSRFKKDFVINIYRNGFYSVDLKGGEGEGMKRKAEPGNC